MHGDHPFSMKYPDAMSQPCYTLRHGVVNLTSLIILLKNITQVQLHGLAVKAQDLPTQLQDS